MLLLPFSRCFNWPTFIDVLLLVATRLATTRVFLLALQYMTHSLMAPVFSAYVVSEERPRHFLACASVLPAGRRGFYVLVLGSTFSSASRPRVVDPASFPFQALRRTSRQRIVFGFRFPSNLCALSGFLRFFPLPDSRLFLE